jgi:hypothetical protein
MTYLAWPDKGLHRLPSSPAGAGPATALINPVLLHDDIVRPELSNDVILAGNRSPCSDQATHGQYRTN